MQRILLVLVDFPSVLTLRRSVSTVAVWLLMLAETEKLTRWGLIEPILINLACPSFSLVPVTRLQSNLSFGA